MITASRSNAGGCLLSWGGPWTARRFASLLVILALAVTWFFVLRPSVIGGPLTLIRVTGQSMEPGMHTGDLAVVRTDDVYEVGEVVAFRAPNPDGSQGPHVIHRIVGVSRVGLTMRGDNNERNDPWVVPHQQVSGQLLLHVPRVGAAVGKLADPVILAALLAALTAFVVIARAPEEGGDGEARNLDESVSA